MKVIYVTLMALLLWNCSNSTNSNEQYSGPLKEFFLNYDNLIADKYKIKQLESEYFAILGKGDQKVIDKYITDFEKMHSSIISEVKKKFPEKTLQLPFEQKDKTRTDVKSLYIESYQFPWNTATRLSYNVGFECDKLEDSPLSLVRFEFIDMDDDIIMSSNVGVSNNGTYQFEIRPEIEFYKFKKIIVSTL